MKFTNNKHYQPNTKRQSAYAWLSLLLCCLFLFYKYIVYVSPSMMTNELMQHFHFQATGLGALAASYFYSYLIMQLFAGPLLDRYSVKNLGSIAILCMSLGLIAFAYSSNLLFAYGSRMLMGLGAAFATVGYLKVTSIWFTEKQYDIVAGLLATAASLGAISSQYPLAYGVEHIGWQHTLVYASYAGFLIASVYFFTVKSSNLIKNNSALLAGFKKLIKSKKVWFLMIYSGFAWSPLAVFGGLWGNPFLQTIYHLNKVQASEGITIAFFGLALGGPLGGYLSTKFNCRFLIMFSGLFLSLITLLGIIYFNNVNHDTLCSELFLFGLSTGPFMLGFSFGKTWYSTALMATFVSIINTGDGIFTAIAEPLVGKLLDLTWSGHLESGVHIYSVHSYLVAMTALPVFVTLGIVALFITYKSN